MEDQFLIKDKTFSQISEEILTPVEKRRGKAWNIAFIISFIAFLYGTVLTIYTMKTGIGVWGNNNDIAWALAIVNFVWWIGIAHAGTFISAVLLLLKQKWRLAINRSAEAMTIFAIIIAASFPIIHLGRPCLFFWLFPFSNRFGPLWINFNSPLTWDLFAILTYLIVSLIFFYIGMIPDLALIRDRNKKRPKKFYKIFALRWLGTAKQWKLLTTALLILASLATPLVISVHSIISLDFALTVLKGWHSTIFPPYFVIGALFSGFAMVIIIVILMRKTLKLESYITINHIEKLNFMLIALGLVVLLAYFSEIFISFYSNNKYEHYIFISRAKGTYCIVYWMMIACNIFIPQLLWFKKLRKNLTITFIIAVLVNIGMWLERYIIIIGAESYDFFLSRWTHFVPTFVETGILIGSIGLFFVCFLLFTRFFPVISIYEVKKLAVSKNRRVFN